MIGYILFCLWLEESIKQNWFLIFDILFVCMILERGLRYSVFMVLYLSLWKIILSTPWLSFMRKLSAPTHNPMIMKFRLNKFHRLFLYSFKQFNIINRDCIKSMFAISISMHLFTNINLICGLIVYNYTGEYKVLILGILITQYILAYISTFNLLKLSLSLINPLPKIYKLIAEIPYDNDYYKIKRCLNYEVFYNKKPFRFQLGPIGDISRMNIFFFIFFYSSQFMHFLSMFLNKHSH